MIKKNNKKYQFILEAAKQLFFKHGFIKTSMDAIAQQAGISKRTVYHHFQNKELLFQAVIKNYWEDCNPESDHLFRTDCSIEENLYYFAKTFLKFLYQHDTIALFRLLITESANHVDLCEVLLVDQKLPFTRKLSEFLTIQNKRKKLAIKDIDHATSFFIGLLKEYHFWPMMLGFKKNNKKLSKTEQRLLIQDAVQLFLAYYNYKL